VTRFSLAQGRTPDEAQQLAAQVYRLLSAHNPGPTEVTFDRDRTITAGPIRIRIMPSIVEVGFLDSFVKPFPGEGDPDPSAAAFMHGTPTAGAVATLALALIGSGVEPVADIADQLVELHDLYVARINDVNWWADTDRQWVLEKLLDRLDDLAIDLQGQVRSS
jgi:hypothetical protein